MVPNGERDAETPEPPIQKRDIGLTALGSVNAAVTADWNQSTLLPSGPTENCERRPGVGKCSSREFCSKREGVLAGTGGWTEEFV